MTASIRRFPVIEIFAVPTDEDNCGVVVIRTEPVANGAPSSYYDACLPDSEI